MTFKYVSMFSMEPFYFHSSTIITIFLIIIINSLRSSGQYNTNLGATSIVNDCHTCQYNLHFLSFREKRYCCRNGFSQCCQLAQLNRPYPEERPEYPIVDLPSSGPGPDPYRNELTNRPKPDPFSRRPIDGVYMPGHHQQGMSRPESPEEPSGAENFGLKPDSTGYGQPSESFINPSQPSYGPSSPVGNTMGAHNRPYQQPYHNNYQVNNQQNNFRPNQFGQPSWPFNNPLIQGIVAPILTTLFNRNPSSQARPEQILPNRNQENYPSSSSINYQGERLGFNGNRDEFVNYDDASSNNGDNKNREKDSKQFQGKQPTVDESNLSNSNRDNNGDTFKLDRRLKSQPTRNLGETNQNITLSSKISPTITPTHQ